MVKEEQFGVLEGAPVALLTIVNGNMEVELISFGAAVRSIRVPDRNGNPVNILKIKPLTDPEKCDQCGLCAALCPMGSIDSADAAHIPGICIKCCACVKKCPTGAKYYTDEKYLYHQHELEEGFARRAEPELFL